MPTCSPTTSRSKRASNESFWLIGQPDVAIERIETGEDTGKLLASVHGFDYYNTRSGNVESGGADRIALWMLDPDYDGHSLFPRQVFFPMAGDRRRLGAARAQSPGRDRPEAESQPTAVPSRYRLSPMNTNERPSRS